MKYRLSFEIESSEDTAKLLDDLQETVYEMVESAAMYGDIGDINMSPGQIHNLVNKIQNDAVNSCCVQHLD